MEEGGVESCGLLLCFFYMVVAGPGAELGEAVAGCDEGVEAGVVRQPRRSLLGGNAAEDGEAEAVGEGGGWRGGRLTHLTEGA